jgi:DNA-3-methyladenine glycosylase
MQISTTNSTANPLDRKFYSRSPQVVARQLLGCVLVSEEDGDRVSGVIVETESYLAEGDSACHAARGRTARTAVMFGPSGMAYVYSIHAKYCFNVVTEREGRASAVLIRAIEPLEGIDSMRLRRRTDAVRDLTRGPARLCQALAIGPYHNNLDLTRGRTLWIETGSRTFRSSQIRVTRRIGVTSAEELELRFAVANHPFVSGPKSMR